MGWAQHYIEQLLRGETVSFRPRGNSMVPLVRSGQLCTVAPLKEDDALKKGDIVLCRVGRAEYLHLVKALQAERVLIGNNRGGTNGWTPRTSVYGRLIAVE